MPADAHARLKPHVPRSDTVGMRNTWTTLYALTAVLALVARGAAQTPVAPPTSSPSPGQYDDVPLFPTRQNAFDIPFQIEEPIPGAEPVEVQLHVSENRGATWHLTAKVKPEEGRFSYKAAHDGEYWYLVRTLNRQGRLLPEKAFEPEMRVLVDTDPPVLELNCTRGGAAEINCTWKTNDPYLKLETLQLSYQGIDSGPNWQSVAAPPSTPTADGAWGGRTTFVPNGVKWPIFVRVEVSDSAGNRAAAQAQVETPAGAGPTSLPIATNPSNMNSTGSALTALPKPSDTPWTASTPTPVVPSPSDYNNHSGTHSTAMRPASTGDAGLNPPPLASHFPGRESVPSVSREAIPTPNAATSPYRPTSEPRPLSSNSPSADESIGPGQVESLPPPPADEPPLRRTLLPSSTPVPTREPTAGPAIGGGPAIEGPGLNTPNLNTPSLNSPSSEKPIDVGPSFSNPGGNRLPETSSTPTAPSLPPKSNAPSSTATSLPSSAPLAATPPGITPRMVNSRRFELEYDIESVGSSGVAKVELWSTRDAGRTWALLSTDVDAASPHLVNVDEEGIYGFRMVIETASGLRSENPQPGDLPEVWVGVDVTKPTAKLVSIQQRGLEEGGTLTLRWEAADRLLTDRPITLSFSEKADGPWTTIASGVPNNGSYEWHFDSRTPERLFIKLEVRDTAGNSTSYVTPEPTIIERVKPQGRIRGVRPIGESARLKQPSQILPR